jgi:hypothetical protein
MRIVTPDTIEQVAWEGYLEPLGKTLRSAPALPRVTLGEPVWWSAAQALEGETGKTWSPPAGGRRYTLVRLSCTLHPPDDRHTRYTEATLAAYLRPRQGDGHALAHDLYPQRLTAESTGKITVALKPDLKFAEVVEVGLLEVGRDRASQRLPGASGLRDGGEQSLLAVRPPRRPPAAGLPVRLRRGGCTAPRRRRAAERRVDREGGDALRPAGRGLAGSGPRPPQPRDRRLKIRCS